MQAVQQPPWQAVQRLKEILQPSEHPKDALAQIEEALRPYRDV